MTRSHTAAAIVLIGAAAFAYPSNGTSVPW